MQEEKHLAALMEVENSVDEALKDPRGLLSRQRLLMTALSLGMQHIVEMWLHKTGAIKPGTSIKHEFFKAEEKRLKTRLSGMLTKQITSLKNAESILNISREIERNRDDVIYGAPLKSDLILREKLDYFFELKKSVREAVGDIYDKTA